MDAILESLCKLTVAAIKLIGQKEILGIIFGAGLGIAISAISGWIKNHREQKDKNIRAARLITGNIEANILVAANNIGIVSNEIQKLPNTFTLDPIQEFLPSAADILLITSSFNEKNSLPLWSALKAAEIMSSQVYSLYNETLALKRAIKCEPKPEIYQMELLPHLKQLDRLLIDTLQKISIEYQKAYELAKSLKS